VLTQRADPQWRDRLEDILKKALAGASAHQAVVATLAYRLLTFWLPLPLGGIAYLLHRRRYGTGGASASATSP